MQKKFFLLVLPLVVWFLGACWAAPIEPPLEPVLMEQSIPPASSTPSPTIIWFPPTATFTPFPTPVITPTIDLRPNIGEILFQDDFSNPEYWQLKRSSNSSIALGKQELTLAVSQPGLSIYTLRESPMLENFYLEITASPGICMGKDEYGLMFRVTPSLDFYRLSLTCDGQLHLDKYYEGRASSPQPKIYSGAVPLGAPSSSRIGIWASGKEMHFYVNQQFQFTIRDPSIHEGSVGLFIRSFGTNSVSVSFSDLIVHQVSSQP